MPIRIPDALPATEVLESENIFVMTEHRAIHQDIRPLRVLILNLMPLKIETETQILRKLSNTPLQVEVDLLQTVTHKATHVPPKHMESFYVDLDDIRNKRYDGMIVTGAPVEKLPFEDVDYWPELCDIFEWAKTNVFSTLYLCWGAQAGAYYHFGIPKYLRHRHPGRRIPSRHGKGFEPRHAEALLPQRRPKAEACFQLASHGSAVIHQLA